MRVVERDRMVMLGATRARHASPLHRDPLPQTTSGSQRPSPLPATVATGSLSNIPSYSASRKSSVELGVQMGLCSPAVITQTTSQRLYAQQKHYTPRPSRNYHCAIMQGLPEYLTVDHSNRCCRAPYSIETVLGHPRGQPKQPVRHLSVGG